MADLVLTRLKRYVCRPFSNTIAMTVAAEKIETRVAFLITPHQLSSGDQVVSSFHVQKSSKGVEYKSFDITATELRKFHSALNKDARDVFTQFNGVSIAETIEAMNKLFSNHADPSKAKQHLLKHQFQIFQSVKPFAGLVKWFHRTSTADGKFRTAPASFSRYKPLLKFDVRKENEQVKLYVYIELNEALYRLDEFRRHHFLLESNNEYFLLTYKDYLCLNWLAELDLQVIGKDPLVFARQVLARLEEDYPVNRNNLFERKVLETVPVHRVLLSELNNSFLMLTPQWTYDGFLVEGPYKEVFETTAEGEAYVIKRDKEAETKFVSLLESLHTNFGKQHNGYYYLPFADAQKKQWFLKAFHRLLDDNIEVVGMDMLHHFRYSPHKPETKVVVQAEEGNRVMIDMRVSFGKEEIPLNVLQKMLLSGQKAIMLKDGSLGILGDEWIEKYAALIKHGKVNKHEVDVARFMALTTSSENNNGSALQPIIKQNWWVKWQQWQTSSDPVYAVPLNVKATLRPYQQKGFEWLTLLAEAGAGGCLADDMGLGKTLQTICFLAYHIHLFPGATNIIVCPSSLIYNWQNELQKFAPGITVAVYHGASRNAKDFEGGKQVIITSYGTIRADAEFLLSKQYRIAVIDESHNIKNPTSQITSVVSQLDAFTRIALSGTPVVNNTFDLYAQLNYALPGMFGSREFFKREYADAIDRYHDEEKIQALQKLTAPFILRRTKEQVATDLPDKTESILWCTMSREQQDLYNDIKDQVRSSLFTNIKDQGLNKSKLAVLQGMLKLRQVCNSPLLLPIDEQQNCKSSVKTDVLLQELQNVIGAHKALVFSQFTSMLDLLTQECDNLGIKYFHFDGQTPPAKRAEMVAAFQDKDSDTHLFFISLKAGNSGLTLTAADYVFLFDPWWNTAVEQQAIDRTHRIGQTKNVFAYKLICKDTIEEKIIQLQQRKQQLADELVVEDDGFIKSLNEEDIAYLFS
jgi:SNF2 family DNA or RNA helicase